VLRLKAFLGKGKEDLPEQEAGSAGPP